MRISRVGAPPGSGMSNVRVKVRDEPAGRRPPKSIRRSVWSAFFDDTLTRGVPVRALILKPVVPGWTAR